MTISQPRVCLQISIRRNLGTVVLKRTNMKWKCNESRLKTQCMGGWVGVFEYNLQWLEFVTRCPKERGRFEWTFLRPSELMLKEASTNYEINYPNYDKFANFVNSQGPLSSGASLSIFSDFSEHRSALTYPNDP